MFAANGGAASADSTTYIEDVFSTYVYTGTNSSPTFINNGIALTSTNGFTAYELDTSVYGYANSLAAGPDGIYTAGYHNSIPFINRRNSSGVVDLSLRLAGSVPSDIAIDSSGNIYCAAGGYLLKINSSGSVVWQITTIARTITSVAFDSSGNVYFVCSNASSSGYNLISLNSSGAWRWGKDLSDNGGPRVKVDSQDNVYVFGRSTTYYAYVSKLNTSGTVAWGKSIKVGLSQNNAQAMTNDVAIDSSGNVYMATQMGSSSGNTDSWGPGIVKYDSTGSLLWVKKLNYSSTYGTPQYRSIDINSSGDIIAVGYSDRGSSSTNYMIVSSYAADGSLNWTKEILSDSSQTMYASPNIAIVNNTVNATAYVIPNAGSTTPYYHLQFDTSSSSFDGNLSFNSNNLLITSAQQSAVTPINISDSGANSISSYTETLGSSTDVTVTVTPTVIWRKKVLPATTSDGGMVWLKKRNGTGQNNIYDTARGAQNLLLSDTTGANVDILNVFGPTYGLTSFNSSGFTLGADLNNENTSGASEASWTFRKAPKFFDVVTFTASGGSATFSHSLGQSPGMVIFKCTNATEAWWVWHRSLGNSSYLRLNTTSASADSTNWVSATASSISVSGLSSVGTYVAYLFAHDTTTDGLIQCGSFTTTAGSNSVVNLGWEPQLLMIKRADGISNWVMLDTMRGWYTGASPFSKSFYANTNDAEGNQDYYWLNSATGFTLQDVGASQTYIYMAIRRGPMRTPTDGTSVYVPVVTQSSGTIPSTVTRNTGFSVDAYFGAVRNTTFGKHTVSTRLQGKDAYLVTSGPNQESWANDLIDNLWDNNTGLAITDTNGSWNGNNASQSTIFHCLKRAPGFFDVVCYTGTGVARTVNHNLGVAPELMIVKRRDSSTSGDWNVYNSAWASGRLGYLMLNATNGRIDGGLWNMTDPTSSVFSVSGSQTNVAGATYVAHLFASCPGVSKVGAYTGTGTSQIIDCGFTAGARFVLIKRTDMTGGDWYIWDTSRGIISGNDPYLLLNTSDAEVTITDYIDPHATGFELSSTSLTASGGTFIYLAIA